MIPSERTHITATVLGCALRLTPPSRPSAVVLSLGDVSVATDLVGETQETALNVSVTDLAVLLNDNKADFPPGTLCLGPETDIEYWTVCTQLFSLPLWRIYHQFISLEARLCSSCYRSRPRIAPETGRKNGSDNYTGTCIIFSLSQFF